VIECHHDHHRTAQQVDGADALGRRKRGG